MNLPASHPKSLIEILFWPLALVVFVVICLRSYLVPIHHDEAATFFFYIQTGEYLPFLSHIDANNHVLNSTLSFVCFKLFGDSLFSIRLPNTLAFLVLAYGCWRLVKQVHTPFAKSLLMGGLLLSFHFLSFYSTSRGYGLAMAFLVVSLSYFCSYLAAFRHWQLILCLLAFQLAISANLILVLVMLPMIAILLISALVHGKLRWQVLLIHIINALLLYYWIKFSFFLQDNHALYYGEGTSYYKTSYVSLVKFISGHGSIWMAYAGTALLIVLLAFVAIRIIRQKLTFKKWFEEKEVVFAFLIVALILGFYAGKKLLGINYPEDRTGVFFYVCFVLFVAFVADSLSLKQNILAGLVLVAFGLHFVFAFNLRKHSLINYEGIPHRFYDYLVSEQATRKDRITIAGHRMRELIYAYDNYRNDGLLNPMDGPEFLHMNADYALALTNEQAFYAPYYTIVDSEPDWNYVLLKRKTPIRRIQRLALQPELHVQGSNEFYDIYKFEKDTVIESKNPVLAEFTFSVKNTEVPNRAWLVLQIDTAGGHYYYQRIALNWIHYKWDETKTYTYDIVSGAPDKKITAIKAYIYNPNGQQLDIYIRRFALYELEGEGVQTVSTVVN